LNTNSNHFPIIKSILLSGLCSKIAQKIQSKEFRTKSDYFVVKLMNLSLL